MPYFFGGDTGLTPEDIKRLRAYAEGQRRQAGGGASNMWDGLAALGAGLSARIASARANSAEAAGQVSADQAFNDIVSTLTGGGEAAAPEAAPDMKSYQDAIASIESKGSGDYSAIGPTNPKLGRALGRYQIMEANIGPWSKKHLGREVSADEFMADPSIQDAIFNGEFGGYVDKYGPEGAARAWLGGPGAVNDPNRADVNGTTTGAYGQRFLAALPNKYAPAVAADAKANPEAYMSGGPAPYDPAVAASATANPDQFMQPAAYAGQQGPSAGVDTITRLFTSAPENAVMAPGFSAPGTTRASAQLSAPDPLDPGAFNAPQTPYAGVVQALMGGGGQAAPAGLPAPATGAPAVPVGAPAAGGLDPRLMTLAGNRFLSPLQQKIAETLIGNQIAAQQPKDLIKGGQGDVIFDPNTGRTTTLGRPKKDLTTDERNYRRVVRQARARGETPPAFDEWLLQGKAAGASQTTTNVNNAKVPDAIVKAGVDASDQADTLAAQVDELAVFRDMALQADTGATVPITLPVRQMFKSVGIDLGENDVPLLEAMQAQQNQMALRLRNPDSGFGLTGNTSNQDVRFLKDAVAGIEKTPAGNRAVLTLMIAKQRRQATLARMKADYIFENGTLKGWGQARDEFVSNNSIFEPEEADFLKSLKTSAEPQYLTGSDAEMNTQYESLPSGSMFFGPDGKLRKKP